MRKSVLTFLSVLLSLSQVMSVPVERVRSLLRLSDGSQVFATSYGDEWFSYFVTDDGYVVEQKGDSLVLTDFTPAEYGSRIENDRMYVRRRVGTASSSLVGHSGSPCLPVLLVSFSDLDFTVAADSASVNDYYDSYCNGVQYSAHGCTGSVRDYYSDMSRMQFQPEFRIIGPVRLDSTYSFYGKDLGSRKDVNYDLMLQHGMEKAIPAIDDWDVFDNDGDGRVDMMMVVFAGLGQNYTNSLGITDFIWPKEQPSSLTVGNVSIAGCSSCSELRTRTVIDGQIYSTIPDGNGVFLHEMSHALGLPDFYDTNYKAFGMDYWSLMDYGSYVNKGYSPVAYTAYEREFMGWESIETLEGPCTLTLSSFAQGGKAYRIVNEENPDEYYILENRQPDGWDDMLCGKFGGGLMVTHVDYSYNTWVANRVNADSRHQRMTIIPANNSLIGCNTATSSSQWVNSLMGNLYPGTEGNTMLTDASVPASTVFTGGYMGKPIYDIELTPEGLVTLKYRPLGTLEQAESLHASDASDTEALLCWDAVPHAECYNVQVFSMGELVAQADSVPDCYWHLDNLAPQTPYTFRVQPLSDSWRNGPWAESPSFRTDEDAISNIAETARMVRVYDLRGVLVAECRRDMLPQRCLGEGVYILRYTDGKIQKIHIRGVL